MWLRVAQRTNSKYAGKRNDLRPSSSGPKKKVLGILTTKWEGYGIIKDVVHTSYFFKTGRVLM